MSQLRFEFNKLKELAVLIMEKNGISPADSQKVADVLLAADLFGIESHGVQRLTMYLTGMRLGRINVNAKMRILKETPLSATIDADAGIAQPVSVLAMEKAIEKAEKSGFGMVVVNNSNHYGIAGYYSMMAAKRGLFGMSMTNTEGLVVPTFGKTPMLGTNPIAISMPASPTMFHLDVSTSVVTAGKCEVYAKAKKPMPEGWSVGSDGQVNTDAAEFLAIRKEKRDGGILPLGGFGEVFGGHKGYGLSMLVEIMTGIMSLGNTSRHVREVPHIEKTAHVFQVIDYGMFGDKKAIEDKLSGFMQELRDSKKADGHDRIYVHGEKEMEAAERVMREGVYMQQATYDEVRSSAEACGIDHGKYLLPVT